MSCMIGTRAFSSKHRWAYVQPGQSHIKACNRSTRGQCVSVVVWLTCVQDVHTGMKVQHKFVRYLIVESHSQLVKYWPFESIGWASHRPKVSVFGELEMWMSKQLFYMLDLKGKPGSYPEPYHVFLVLKPKQFCCLCFKRETRQVCYCCLADTSWCILTELLTKL